MELLFTHTDIMIFCLILATICVSHNKQKGVGVLVSKFAMLDHSVRALGPSMGTLYVDLCAVPPVSCDHLAAHITFSTAMWFTTVRWQRSPRWSANVLNPMMRMKVSVVCNLPSFPTLEAAQSSSRERKLGHSPEGVWFPLMQC